MPGVQQHWNRRQILRGAAFMGALILILAAVGSCRGMSGAGSIEGSEYRVAEEDAVMPRSTDPNPPGKVFIVEDDPMTAEEQIATFSLPPGFEIQLVAAEESIQKPMQLAFDEKGRLLVSTSTNYPLGPAPGGPPSDRVMLIEIDGETGAATDIKVFADGFDICSGIEAMPGGRVVLAHIPDILLLRDVNGDGTADETEVLYTGFARDDTHEIINSLTWGVDGWLYALDGHSNSSEVTDRHGVTKQFPFGNVYRMRPDGGSIEIFARGMSNPWGLTFDKHYNLFASDCESRPLWQIVQGYQYQGFRQVRDPLGFAPFITEDAHGASGFAGLVSYRATAFPPRYRDDLFLGNPINGIIHRDSPDPRGSTHHMVRRPDFMTCDDPWFRPVDVELGPDGALYIADWYNSIIAHVEVPLTHPARDKGRGRIWRIVYRGTDAERADPLRRAEIQRQFEGPMAIDWSKASRTQLIRALDDANGWVRRMAAAQLDYRFPDAAPRPFRRILSGDGPTVPRAEAMWWLRRNGHLDWEDIQALLNDADSVIRVQALDMAVAMADADESIDLSQNLIAALADASPRIAREAALAIKARPSIAGLDAVLAMLADHHGNDTLLEHGLRISARDQLSDDAVFAQFVESGRADTPDDELVTLVAATATEPAASLLAAYMAEGKLPERFLPQAFERILRNGDAAAFGVMLDHGQQAADASPAILEAFVRALATQGQRAEELGVPMNDILEANLPKLAGTGSDNAAILAYESAARFGVVSMLPYARRAVRDSAVHPRARHLAGDVALQADYEGMAPILLAMVADSSETVDMRKAMAFELGRRATERGRFEALIGALANAPAAAYEGAVESLRMQRPGVDWLLDAIEEGRVSPAHINNHVTRIRIESHHRDPALNEQYARLVADLGADDRVMRQRIADIKAAYTARGAGDVRNGQLIFEQNCIVCHRVQGRGGMRGPNLDGIDARGIDRMLQDILLPNIDVDPTFYTTIIRRKNGLVEEGLVVEEDGQRLLLVDETGWESEIAIDEIAERRRSRVSPMPANFESVIEESDFLDLIQFLMTPPARFVPVTEGW